MIGAMLLAVGAVASLASCDKEIKNPEGSWKSAAPEKVTESIEGAASATQEMELDFKAPAADAEGVVTLTTVYDVTKAVPDSVGSSYKVTASIQGTWTAEKGEDDDYLLTFDKNTLSVSGVDAPELGIMTDVFLNSLSKFTTIEDVEVSKDKAHLTFETNKPEVKYHFVKAE